MRRSPSALTRRCGHAAGSMPRLPANDPRSCLASCGEGAPGHWHRTAKRTRIALHGHIMCLTFVWWMFTKCRRRRKRNRAVVGRWTCRGPPTLSARNGTVSKRYRRACSANSHGPRSHVRTRSLPERFRRIERAVLVFPAGGRCRAAAAELLKGFGEWRHANLQSWF